MTSFSPALDAQVAAWIEQDPDISDSTTLTALLDRARAADTEAQAALSDWFGSTLHFGTAGLRGPMRPGPSGMNRVTVAHASWGVGMFLARRQERATTPTVVIGYDARKHSEVFAADTAHVLANLGLAPLLFDQQTPTPLVAFAVRYLNADAGVMITASHNPPGDNGYKVYLGGADAGSQIVPPTDTQIEALIVESFASQPASDLVSPSASVTSIGQEVIDAYRRETLALAHSDANHGRAELVVAYTPLHGVGAGIFTEIARDAGFSGVSIVASQAEPNGSFPTVSFPNPEESGTLDLLHAHAEHISADLAIAHDPDADRLAVSLPHSENGRTQWRMLTGNELGVLLLDAVARALPPGTRGSLARSLVTTPMIDRVASAHNLTVVATPTGFKWISRAPCLVAGCEEALGYLVNPDTVRDKDGISAGLLALLIAAQEKNAGRTLSDRLDDIRDRLGGFASGQVTLRAEALATIHEIMPSLRASIGAFVPEGFDHRIADYRDGLDDFPPSDIVTCESADGSRIIFRPSGTEPKLKVYLDVLSSNQESADSALDHIRHTVAGLLAPLASTHPGVTITSS